MEDEEAIGPDVSYTPYEDLQPPKTDIPTTWSEIQSSDWRVNFEGVDHTRELAKHNFAALFPEII
jgi:hypothetical protein